MYILYIHLLSCLLNFSIITLLTQAVLIKEKYVFRWGSECWPFWHVVINYSNWGLQSTESTSHIHGQTHFSPQYSWKRSCAEKNKLKKITWRSLFTFIQAYWANKNGGGTCVNYMEWKKSIRWTWKTEKASSRNCSGLRKRFLCVAFLGVWHHLIVS